MNRDEAVRTMLGKRVSTYSDFNGCYVGTLAEILPTRPWRGKVIIDGIVSPAVCWQQDRPYRRGFRVGETIEVGGTNIEPTDALGHTDYVALVEADGIRLREQHAAYLAGLHGNPEDPKIGRLYGWMLPGAHQVDAAVERLRYETLPLDEAVLFWTAADMGHVKTPMEDERVSNVIRRLPSRRSSWNPKDRAWNFPERDVDALREGLEAIVEESEIAGVLLGKIPAAASPAYPQRGH